MAHNIFQNPQTLQHSFFSTKQKAWHGLGQVVEDYPTSAEAIKFAGLDFQVDKRPLFTFNSENFTGNPESDILIPEIKVPDSFSTVRADLEIPLGVVGKDYKVVQNATAFNFFDSCVESGRVKYETAGALGKGEKIFITAKLKEPTVIGKDDPIENYLFLTNDHSGKESITIAFTPIRIVCNNTLNAAMKNCTNRVRIRHTENVEHYLAQAIKVMGLADKLSVQYGEKFNRWAKIKITDKEVKKLIQAALAPSVEVYTDLLKGVEDTMSTNLRNKVEKAFEYAMSHPTQLMETTQGTLYGAYNAVTGYFQNVSDFKTEETKFRSIVLEGNTEKFVQTAFNLCHTFEQNGSIFLLNN
uniref:DUF932 domain-containing protein n=1 Tax=Pedobacter schmidteae TaxID=2201271 RepID=UPI000EB2E324|nr:DUF932 domain-containing protein [Pedobacter schmidteae]